MRNSRRRLAILSNVLAPYRVPIYRLLGDVFDTTVMLSGTEDNRKWRPVESRSDFAVVTVKGWTLKWRSFGPSRRTHDLRYLHFNPGYLWELFLIRPDAIISNEMGLRSLLSLVYGRFAGVPVWVWWGGTLHTEIGRSRFRRILRQQVFARVVARWISYGETSTAYLQSLGIPAARILQIQNCVEAAPFIGDVEPYPLKLPRPRALFVGQLIGRKGVSELLTTAANVQRMGLACSLAIVGDGPEQSHVKAEIQRLGIRNVELLGNVPHDRIAGVYKAADFLVFPTLEDVWGLVVNEALLSGLPVIASKYAGCAEELLLPAAIFDPLDGDSFLNAFRKAIQGQITLPEPGRLMSAEEVAGMIACDIESHLGRRTG